MQRGKTTLVPKIIRKQKKSDFEFKLWSWLAKWENVIPDETAKELQFILLDQMLPQETA